MSWKLFENLQGIYICLCIHVPALCSICRCMYRSVFVCITCLLLYKMMALLFVNEKNPTNFHAAGTQLWHIATWTKLEECLIHFSCRVTCNTFLNSYNLLYVFLYLCIWVFSQHILGTGVCWWVYVCGDALGQGCRNEPWQRLALVLNAHLPPFKGSKACWDAVKCLQCCGWLLQHARPWRVLWQLTALITHPWPSIEASPPFFLPPPQNFWSLYYKDTFNGLPECL